jgi:lysylphosphatidylglycerol synthetase-like protein (DUF2156 family)/UDP-2,3-diacylglucosamine pyrophosphatase LpxH
VSSPDTAPIFDAETALTPPSAPSRTAPGDGNGDDDRSTGPDTAPLVPDLVELSVPRGGRVIVVSDLHLSAPVTDAARNCTAELARVIGDCDGPGLLVIAGDGFELLAGPDPNIHRILDAHAEFAATVKAFATSDTGHHVVVLSGNHDGQIAWDPDVVAALRDRLGATEIAVALDVVLDTGEGPERVHVVHGNQDDHYNAFIDIRSPIDTPMGHHVVREVLPQLEKADKPGSLLEGIPWLNDSSQIAEMVASRLFYRKIGGRLWWLATPFIAAAVLRLVAFLPGVDRLLRDHAERWLIGLGLAIVAVLVVAAVAALVTMLRVHHALEHDLASHTGVASHNAAPRERAARMVAGGYAGLVSGHTHEPELSVVGPGFYANSGCGVVVVGAYPARLGLPRPFLAFRRCSRVELSADEVLRVRLVVGDTPVRSAARLERAVARSHTDVPTTPRPVAALPGGAQWPTDPGRLPSWVARRRVRRVAATLLALAGVLNVVSALLPTIGSRLHGVEQVVPLHVPRAAGVLAILGGLAMIGLAPPLRRGYRPAYVTSLVVLAGVAVAMVLRSFHLEQAVLTLALGVWLLTVHEHFEVVPPGRRRWVMWTLSLGLGAIVAAGALAAAFDRPERLARDVTGAAIGLVALLAVLATRAGRQRTTSQADQGEARRRARAIVADVGGDTLDQVARRDDRDLLFTGHGVAAYNVFDRTMVVAPDPICPPEERAGAWADVMDHADSRGWAVAVLAANASWLPTYHDAGLHDVYIGDEGIIDCQQFSLDGDAAALRGPHEQLRAAGFRVEVRDPLTVAADERQALLTLAADGPGRFSMTLGRLFDPRDTGLLMGICLDGGGAPVAFNQYVPAGAISGFSLDATGCARTPVGLTDFVIVETIAWLAARGHRNLGLNLVRVLNPISEAEDRGPWRGAERLVLHHAGDSPGLALAWPFDRAPGFRWRPRYAITDTMLGRSRASVAIAREESLLTPTSG